MRDRSFTRELPALKAKTTPILLSCSWGLANRLRSIAHYAAARSSHVVDPTTYRFLGRPISYAWGPSTSLGGCGNTSMFCSFGSLFEPLPARYNMTVVDVPLDGDIRRWPDYLRGKSAAYEVLANDCGDVPPQVLTPTLYADLFRPVASIRAEAVALVKAHRLRTCVGMHARGTDLSTIRKVAGQHATADEFRGKLAAAFEARIHKELRGAAHAPCFFLATDDKFLQERFRAFFRTEPIARAGATLHIHHEITTAPVVSLGGHRSHTLRSTSAADAVLEAYVLAHCKKIWGTYGSSFSALASRWLPRPRGSFELMRVQEAG